ncbi:MAG TPA: hypothetical protein VFF27_08980 [Bacteroidia bacterium]|jgi:hypothetical protein|nr:hypothetical protein [Bacteroidia bacterium]
MIDTTIHIGEVAVHEPMTVFTDFIIAGLALTFYFRLKRETDKTVINWRYFFLFMGVSTFVGAFSHALFEVHQGWGYKSFWLPMQLINGLAVYYAQQGTCASVLDGSPFKKTWALIYKVQLIVFLIAVPVFQNFLVTVIDNALGLIPVMILHYRYKTAFAKRIANGIAISFLTAAIHINKFSIHTYFNYNDLAHVFIMISLWVLYTGVKMKKEISA